MFGKHFRYVDVSNSMRQVLPHGFVLTHGSHPECLLEP
jgi:hypothetical protein